MFRQRLMGIYERLQILRWNTLRVLSFDASAGELAGPAMITKLYWASLHRDLGELSVDVLGASGALAESLPYDLTREQKIFLFTRSDTIYGGSNQIQRNVIGERALGLPREPKVAEG